MIASLVVIHMCCPVIYTFSKLRSISGTLSSTNLRADNSRALDSIFSRIERALIESEGREIQMEHLHFAQLRASAEREGEGARKRASTLPLNLKEAEAILIQRALEQTDGHVTEAARLLGIGRKTLYRKLHDKT